MPQSILFSDISSGVTAMDALHHEIFDALDELSSVTDGEFINRYDAFVEKLERAFATEDAWMDEIDFPVLKSHGKFQASCRLSVAFMRLFSVLDNAPCC